MIDSEISDKAKSVGKAKRAVDELAKAKPAGDLEALPLFEKTIGALRGVSDSGLIETLEEKSGKFKLAWKTLFPCGGKICTAPPGTPDGRPTDFRITTASGVSESNTGAPV